MKRSALWLFAALVVAIVALVAININAGTADLSVADTAKILWNHEISSVNGKIVWDIRLPRVIAAATLGGALALSGYLLQAFFSNPIAGPYVLGISFSAKLAVAVLMILVGKFGIATKSYMTIGAAFLGAMLASFVVVAIARRVKNMATLIVCGVMIGYVCSAATELLVSFADDANIVNLHNWSIGSFSATSWGDARAFAPVCVVGLVAALLLAKGIEAYLYGEEYAASLGMNVRLFRVALILTSSLLSATVTAFAGPISFVGIAAPHVVRRTFRTSDPRIVIPAAFLFGAAFCLFCDLLAKRMFAPKELGVGTITAIFGAPIVVSMLLQKKR